MPRKAFGASANLKEVSVRAGHSFVAFTLDRYGHLYHDTEDDIPERLDALLARCDVSDLLGVEEADVIELASKKTERAL
jgi:hypothetical protein